MDVQGRETQGPPQAFPPGNRTQREIAPSEELRGPRQFPIRHQPSDPAALHRLAVQTDRLHNMQVYRPLPAPVPDCPDRARPPAAEAEVVSRNEFLEPAGRENCFQKINRTRPLRGRIERMHYDAAGTVLAEDFASFTRRRQPHMPFAPQNLPRHRLETEDRCVRREAPGMIQDGDMAQMKAVESTQGKDLHARASFTARASTATGLVERPSPSPMAISSPSPSRRATVPPTPPSTGLPWTILSTSSGSSVTAG